MDTGYEYNADSCLEWCWYHYVSMNNQTFYVYTQNFEFTRGVGIDHCYKKV